MWQSNTVEVNSQSFHYTRTGGDKPTLILAHGVTDHGLCWTAVAEALEANYDVIMVDTRGHGLSSRTETDYTWKALADDLYKFIIALELEKPFILGHSLGAMTALIFASHYPDVPKAVLLEDPPNMWIPVTTSPQEAEQRMAEFRKSIINRRDQSRDELIAKQRQDTPQWSEKEIQNWADSKPLVDPNVSYIFKDVHDWSSDLSNMTCPALLIKADPDKGALVTDETAKALQEIAPQLQVAHINNAGHSIHRDQFDNYMQVVRDFLSQF